jgi:lysyl-tRNA synthetase class 2
MKRLLAGGLSRIYSLGKVFRRGERGPRHNPEFTMLEWYRANADWREVARDVELLISSLSHALGVPGLAAPWRWLSVREAMRNYAGIELDGDEPVAELAAKVRAAGHRVPEIESPDYSDVFFAAFLDAVEPHLGKPPTILHDWPAPMCALARRRPDDPRVVERFEAYATTPDGSPLELCNGFGELIDPVEQRRRLLSDDAERARRGLQRYPIDEKFLAALADMPPSAGVAVGVDRIAMLLLQRSDIREVLPFAWEEL